MDSDKRGLLRYGWTYQNTEKRAALMYQLYGVYMGGVTQLVRVSDF